MATPPLWAMMEMGPRPGHGAHPGEGQGQTVLHVHAAQAVGPDQAYVVLLQEGSNLILQGQAGLAQFRKAGGLHDYPGDPQFAAVLQQAGNKAGRRQDHHQVHRLGQVPQARVDGQIKGGAGLASHQENLALVTELQQVMNDPPGQVVGALGNSHYCQAVGVEEFFHISPESIFCKFLK